MEGVRPTTPDLNTISGAEVECEEKARDVIFAQREMLEC